MNPIREEIDLGDQKKAFKGKTIKIKKIIKKESGSFTLKDTYIQADETLNNTKSEGVYFQGSEQLFVDSGQVLPPDSALQSIPDNLDQEGVTLDKAQPFNFNKPAEPRQPREIRQ